MYRQPKRTGIMLCYPFEERRLERWGGRALVQPKLDGVRARAIYNRAKGRWILLSSEANEIFGVPHLPLELSAARFPIEIELDGEIYTHGLHFEEIFSRTSRSQRNIHPDYHTLNFNIFDLIEPYPQLSRSKRLIELSSQFAPRLPHFKRVETFYCSSLDSVMEAYNTFCDDGYEGMIVRKVDGLYERKRSVEIMKFKPKKKDWYTVVGWKEEVDKNGRKKGTLGALVAKGDDGTEFLVGSGLTAAQRLEYWSHRDELVGKLVEVEFQHITPKKGVPRFPIFTRIIDPMQWEKGGQASKEIK